MQLDNKGKFVLVAALIIGILLVALVVARPPANKPTAKPKEECRDKIDNDGDGNIDMADTGCDTIKDNDETDCGDGVCEGGENASTCPEDCGSQLSCDDTDGGNIITVFGMVYGQNNSGGYNLSDYCVGSTGDIVEFYCSGVYAQQ